MNMDKVDYLSPGCYYKLSKTAVLFLCNHLHVPWLSAAWGNAPMLIPNPFQVASNTVNIQRKSVHVPCFNAKEFDQLDYFYLTI